MTKRKEWCPKAFPVGTSFILGCGRWRPCGKWLRRRIYLTTAQHAASGPPPARVLPWLLGTL
jgi:hypothetical protein